MPSERFSLDQSNSGWWTDVYNSVNVASEERMKAGRLHGFVIVAGQGIVIEERMKVGWLCGQCLTHSLSTGEAVFARCLSSLKDERVAASKEITGPAAKFTGDKTAFVEDIRKVGHVSGF